MLLGELLNSHHASLCDVAGINPNGRNAFCVSFEHDLHGFIRGFLKKASEDVDDKLLRRVIIVHDQDAVEVRLFGPNPLKQFDVFFATFVAFRGLG